MHYCKWFSVKKSRQLFWDTLPERHFWIGGHPFNLAIHDSDVFQSQFSYNDAAKGISSHVLFKSIRPFFFLCTPPHCLKKNGTLYFRHCLFISSTHSSFIGLAPGPDSPPTITQSIPFRFTSPILSLTISVLSDR